MALFFFLLARTPKPQTHFSENSFCDAEHTLSIRQAQFVQDFPLKPAPFCKLYAGLSSTNKSAISLLFSFSQTLVLPSPHCTLFRLSFFRKLSRTIGMNYLLTPPLLSGRNGSPENHFFRETMRLIS